MKNNNFQTIPAAIFLLLAALMAVTRYNHFGSAVALPDASLAVFFLGGLYLARYKRASAVAFFALILQAGMIDFYATSAQGVSDWCMTTAYWFLIPIYAGLWGVGRWFSLRHSLQGKGLLILLFAAWASNSLAFVFSNATFYLFSAHFSDMSVAEYASRVAQYYGSYVAVALMYIACAVAIHIICGMIGKQRMPTPPNIA